MEELFNGDPLNRSIEEIKQMFNCLHNYEFFLRSCIWYHVSRLLMDTSEEKHIDIIVPLDHIYTFGETPPFMPCVTQIWQHPSEGIITTEVNSGEYDSDDCTIMTGKEWSSGALEEIDFDEYNTEEQIEILEGILWVLNSR